MTRARKSTTRLYVDAALDRPRLPLDPERAHYLSRVLRCREGDELVVFNARGDECLASIESLSKRHPLLRLGEKLAPLPESAAAIVLLQALVKSDAMDLIVQKATELGVDRILAVRTEFSVVRLDDERRGRRLAHWRRIALGACEQSGRHRPPALEVFAALDPALAALPASTERVACDVGAGGRLADLSGTAESTTLAIGPEGGFSPGERDQLVAAGFRLCSLGPRTLRAETAAIAACTAVQLLSGDLGKAPGPNRS